MKPTIHKTLVASGLKAKNKDEWKGSVLFFEEEDNAIHEDRNIVFVKYDPNDGRGVQEYSGDKIRQAKGVRRTSNFGRNFVIYSEKDLVE